ncbi:8738_t:CDS:2 [Racocetra fulgida]|uniref:dTMP kinase n=1 Tax=Racocetra fulgida TaxID=60492 RepID=A0A9N9ICI1_9GLOM|nr:8738_t:CDS:2 [Racocetra fulgida]
MEEAKGFEPPNTCVLVVFKTTAFKPLGHASYNQELASAFLTAFVSLNEEIIKPNLQQNKIIIIDRYFDSTLVYQGATNETDFNKIFGMTPQRDILRPDLTFILDLDPQAAQKRL